MKYTFVLITIAISINNLVCMEPEFQKPAEPQLLGTINEQPYKMALSNNQKLLAMAYKNVYGRPRKLHVYDATTCDKKFELDLPENITDMRFSNDNTNLHLITWHLLHIPYGTREMNYSLYKYFVINNETGAIIKSCNLDIQHTLKEVEEHSPKIWSDYLCGFTKKSKSYEQIERDIYIISLLKVLLTFNFSPKTVVELCSATAKHKEYTVSPDGNYLAYCPSEYEISIMDVNTKQCVRTLKIFIGNDVHPWEGPLLNISPRKIFISNDQSLIIESLDHLSETRVSQSIYKTTSEDPQKLSLVLTKTSTQGIFGLEVHPLDIELSPDSTFIALHKTAGLKLDVSNVHTLQIIDLSNPNTTLELFDEYRVWQGFFKPPYPLALGNTTIAFPIPSKRAESEFQSDETVVGIFDIKNTIKSAS